MPVKPSLRSRLFQAQSRIFLKRAITRAADLPIARLRRRVGFLLNSIGWLSPGMGVRRAMLGDLRAHWVGGGSRRQRGTILYLHGGAMVMETPGLHTAFLRRLCKSSGMAAVMPAYRLAPEHPWPAAVEDCFDSYHSLLDAGRAPESIALVGDSAGGTLVATTLQLIRDRGLPLPACAVLISPAMELTGSLDSHRRNKRRDSMLDGRSRSIFNNYYLGRNARRAGSDPLVSPYLADYAGLPPLLFIASDAELLADDSADSAARAEGQGVRVRCELWPGQPHAFPVLPPVLLPEAQQATRAVANFIRDELTAA